MQPLKNLFIGDGISGLATAFRLAKQGHNVIMLERHAQLRAQAIQVLQRMNLLDAVRNVAVKEERVSMVTPDGTEWAFFPSIAPGKGRQSFTSKFEVMRGDLMRLLYEAIRDNVEYRFGLSLATDAIQDLGDVVGVTFDHGEQEMFDLVISTGGSSSRLRKNLVLGSDAEDAFKPLGIWIAYCKIPVSKHDKPTFTSCHFPHKRFAVIRAGSKDQTQANLGYPGESAVLDEAVRNPVVDQKKAWFDLFRDGVWELPRIFAGIDVTNDFYYDRLDQVELPVWSGGCVVLVGDAGYCPRPLTGCGETLSLLGAYVLAGEISKYGSQDMLAALQACDRAPPCGAKDSAVAA